MKIILALSKRNLRLFVRDKALVFFSFLSVIIILGLYVLFLGEIQVNNIKQSIGMDLPEIDALVYAWMLPGLIAVASMTLSLGNMGRLVDDAQAENLNDFLVSPLKRWQLILSYLLSSVIITSVISVLMFGLSIVIVKLKGGPWLNVEQILQSLGVMILLIVSSALLSLYIASWVKTQNTYGVVNSMVGTFIGFVTGAYMPMGIMPVFVQNMFNILPVSLGASMLRQIYLGPIMDKVFAQAPIEMVNEYRYFQGIDLKVFGNILEPNFMLIVIFVSIGVLFILNLLRFTTLSKRS
ncbi:MAG: ABC transporter permease [Erysipelotrichaceae bacterium]